MTPGTLAAILTAVASILGSVAAILHSLQTRRIVRKRLPTHRTADPAQDLERGKPASQPAWRRTRPGGQPRDPR